MNSLQSFIASKPMGFLHLSELPALIALDRLCPILVRMGRCRFTCAAQDALWIIRCLESSGDWQRDVSFPVGSAQRAALWQPDAHIPASFVAQRPPRTPVDQRPRYPGSPFNADPGL